MRTHYFQHVPFEGLGCVQPWLQKHAFQITSTRFFESPQLPNLTEIDLLVVMGGPMSINDELQFPWLLPEKAFIRRAIEAEKPVLGICLGAQLIASALGAEVYPNGEKEIGWFPIEAVTTTDQSVFRFPPTVKVFHWHGETFDLPSGAVHLARSSGCENQAFQIGQRVIGLQFHLETRPEDAEQLIWHGREELQPAQYVQAELEMLAAPPERYQIVNELMDRVVSFLLDLD